MANLIAINYQNCVGCRECEVVCSSKHDGNFNPFFSRIRIVKWPNKPYAIPTNCNQCLLAPCLNVCPGKAISRDEELLRVQIDYDKCIGCRSCVAACPFGAMHFSETKKKVYKCDLCDGDPLCVKACVYKAIVYIDSNEQCAPKRLITARRILDII